MLNKTQFLKNPKQILILILLFAAVLRLYRLDYPNAYVFDEVYHAFTAKEYLKASKAAWDPFATPPKGVAYEWTHPPLAKEVMAFSMFLLHTTDSWAWRLPGALLGILSVYILYLLSKSLFQSETIALASGFIFSVDGLNFVQSRVGMNDIYLVTFCLTSLLFFIKKRFVLSAIFLGLAISSKWTGIYLLGVFILLLLYYKKFWQILFFLIIPPIIYLLSYLPYFLLGYNFNQFIELQKQMWWYHTTLKAHHDYQSLWWSWPINLYPVWFFVEYKDHNIANIFTSGNLVVFLFGLVAIFASLVEAIKKRSERLGLIILGYFTFLLPWALSPRIAFLYHYSPSVPFLSLALGYQLDKFLHLKSYRGFYIACIILMIVCFLLTYPFLTGIPLPRNIVHLFFQTNFAKDPFSN